jgi:hypothetical protein
MAGTFISYRREDAAGYAGRLRESLERKLGAARVFRDVDTLRPGQDFVQAIEARLADCAVMLAVIGREWAGARDLAGSRRLDEPFDFVRIEIAAALARPEVLVVPVLVEGASMPTSSELPDNLKALTRRHAVSLRDETWDADVDRLVNVIEGAFASRDPSRADAPISAAQMWVAAALAVVIVGLLVFNGRRPRPDAVEAPAAGNTGGRAGPPVSTAGGSPYTIDVPRLAEVAFEDVIYAVAAGNVVIRDDGPELRLRIRVMNFSRNDVNFWDDSFRLAASGEVLTPTSGLNEIAPGNSLRYGIVTFKLRPQMRTGTLRIVNSRNSRETAEIPLDLSPTGRPPVDENAEIADSMGQAIQAAVVRDPVPLLEGGDVSVALERASTRRFANALRLTLSLRIANSGRTSIHSNMIEMRVQAGGEQRAPFQSPNEVIDSKATATGTVAFDLPTTTTRAVLRTTVGDRTVEKTLELK